MNKDKVNNNEQNSERRLRLRLRFGSWFSCEFKRGDKDNVDTGDNDVDCAKSDIVVAGSLTI